MKKFSINTFLNSRKPKNGRFYTVAIDGRGGSGKTHLANYLKNLLPDFVFLNGDDYFEPMENDVAWGVFNDKRFIEDVIKPLKTGDNFVHRPYNWHSFPHITEEPIEVKKGVCIERCFSFDFDLNWDLKIWVETPKEICLRRGIAREHMAEEVVIKVWRDVWQPKEDEYIAQYEPQKQADFVIDGTKAFNLQLI